jgi:hypothetical protein
MADAPEEWGPLIKHDGKDCPVTGMFCEVHDAAGRHVCGIVVDKGADTPCSLWVWEHLCFVCYPFRVVAYRIRKPRALLDLIERAKDLDDAPEGPIRTKELENV